MLFDTHVHLNARQFMKDREEVIHRAKSNGVNYMTVVGFDEETIPLAIEMAENYETIDEAVGWHPVDAIDFKDKLLQWLEVFSAQSIVVAFGEMGLDYHWDTAPKKIHEKVFREQIRLAKRLLMAIIIPNREATND